MISVIVPAYNAEKTVEKCVNSILEQTYADLEVIVIDDGSTDGTSRLIHDLAMKDQRVRGIFQKNQGASAARNRGMKEATGEYIVFVDADDEIMPDMLDVLIKNQTKYKADLVKTSLLRISDGGKIEKLSDSMIHYYKSKPEWKEKFFDLLANEWNSPVGKLYKKEIIDTYQICFHKKLELSEDLHFNLLYLERIDRVLCLPEAYYKYHLFNSNATTKYREHLFEHRKLSISMLDDFLIRNEILRVKVHYLYIKLLFSSAMHEWEHRRPRKERISEIKRNLHRKEVQEAITNCMPEEMAEKLLCLAARTQNAGMIDLLSKLLVKVRQSQLFSSARKISV